MILHQHSIIPTAMPASVLFISMVILATIYHLVFPSLSFSRFHPNFVHFSVLKMPAPNITTIKLLIKEINTLSNSLLDSVPKGSKDDKIWSVMNTEECDNPHETFNRRFDAMFAEDCQDSNGCLHHLRQGKLGINLVVSYLSKINWTTGFPLDLVEIKLQRLITELKFLQYVPCFFFGLFV